MNSKRFIQTGLLMAWLISNPFSADAQEKIVPERYQRLSFGSIKPSGWLKIQMQADMAGFVGNLDKLVPDLINDPIYGSGRLHRQSKAKDLGNLKEGDAGGDDQYKWWNSETQSNWWDGYIRNAILLEDPNSLLKVRKYIERILATQDDDGYLGIYDPDLRYNFTSENGELWSKTTLFRGLLAWYEYSGDPGVWKALVRAVDNVMQHYPVNRSHPFNAGKEFAGGVAHGLTFTDVLDRMYQLTGEKRYLEYALFLYMDYSENFSFEKDAQLSSILDSGYHLQCHGVHTYEHVRPLMVAAGASGNSELGKALEIYLSRIRETTTESGGATGDEWIGGRKADATHTGYEYCSIHELLDSYTLLLQKTGSSNAADMAENIFFNAAQGSRNPDHSCIAYLKTDNSYEMLGTKNGEVEPDRNQTRYKYSPAHQDVAVCCSPNAGRITPYFLQSAWFREGDDTLVAAFLAPSILETTLGGVRLKIENDTEYPYNTHFVLKVTLGAPRLITLKIRKPAWVKSIGTTEQYQTVDGYMIISRTFNVNDKIEFEYKADITVREDINHEKYFTFGPLVFACPIDAVIKNGRSYSPGFDDLLYSPRDSTRYGFIQEHNARFRDGKIVVNLKNNRTKKVEKVELIPLGKTILRQAAFR